MGYMTNKLHVIWLNSGKDTVTALIRTWQNTCSNQFVSCQEVADKDIKMLTQVRITNPCTQHNFSYIITVHGSPRKVIVFFRSYMYTVIIRRTCTCCVFPEINHAV